MVPSSRPDTRPSADPGSATAGLRPVAPWRLLLPLSSVLAACAGMSASQQAVPEVCAWPAEQPALEQAPAESPRLRVHGLADTLSEGVQSWFEGHGSRRLHVQLDRPLYRPGEAVWVRSWDLRTVDLRGAEEAQGVRYELVDPRGSVVESKDVRQEGGSATNDLVLPESAPGGAWTLRATTTDGETLERVFIVDHYEAPRLRKELEFAREAYGPGDTVRALVELSDLGGPLAGAQVQALVIVDGEVVARQSLVADDEGAVLVAAELPEALRTGQGLVTAMVDVGGVVESISRSIPITHEALQLAFFPEGGDLVSGLPSRVYFEATDAFGRPADIEGYVEDDTGEVLGRVASVHDGLGRFELRPMPGRSYRVVLEKPSGVDRTFALPEARSEGCVLRTWDDLDGELPALRASVRCTAPQEVVVLGSLREQVLDAAVVEAGPSRAATVYLAPEHEELARRQGVARVTVFDRELVPLAERVVYRNPEEGLHIELSADKEQYRPREEVVLTVRTRLADGTPVPAELSLSVADDRVLAHADDERGHILSRLYLESELPSAVDDPAWYFDPEEEEAHRGLDLLMGTKGYRRFEWRQVFEADDPEEHDDAAPGEDDPLLLADAGPGSPAAEVLPTWREHIAERLARRWEPEVQRWTVRVPEDASREEIARQVELQDPWSNGLHGALGDGGDLDAIFGRALLQRELSGGIGGLIGARGQQLGAGGLGARGAGLGGGGTAEGLGGNGVLKALERVGGVVEAQAQQRVVEALPGERVARKDAKKRELDKVIAEQAGVLGAIGTGPPAPEGAWAEAAAEAPRLGELRLAAGGEALGGGDAAAGLAGLGTKGRASGASGYGIGAGNFGSGGGGRVAPGRVAPDPAMQAELDAPPAQGASAEAAGDLADADIVEVKPEGRLPPVASAPVVMGAMDRSGIDAVVRRHLNQIRYCYQRELNRDPELAGKATVRFTIAADGSVSRAEVGGSTLGNASVERCLEGRFLRFRFPAPQGGGEVAVSYPFHFESDGSGSVNGQRPVRWITVDKERTVWAPVRVFPRPAHDPAAAPPAVRDDFRDTIAWEPDLRTDETGTAEVRFHLSDAVTTFRAVVEGLGGTPSSAEELDPSGALAGRGELELTSRLPFHVDTRLPAALSTGDRLLLPVTLSSTLGDAVAVDLEAALGAGVRTEEALSRRLELPASGARTVLLPLVAEAGRHEVSVALRGQADGLEDALSRSLRVEPRGFPRSLDQAGELSPGRHTLTVDLGEILEGSLEAELALHPSPVATLVDGLERLVGMPGGCFEQTSSTNYPNVLVLDYLRSHRLEPALQVDAEQALATGYARLAGYQVASGGFETFGSGPGKEALSAYGLRQFTAMQAVYDGVSAGMMAEDRRFLLDRRDGTGGYENSGRSSHDYGSAPKELLDTYITWALVSTGERGLDAELRQVAHLAERTEDPYLLALATSTLLRASPEAGRAAAGRLARLQDPDGSWPGAATTVVRSGGHNALVETTALATLALVESGRHTDAVNRGASWLVSHRDGRGAWGATQATVLALEALTATARGSRATRGPGSLEVRVDGRAVDTLRWERGQRRALVLDDLEPHLVSGGRHTLELVYEGEDTMPFVLDLDWTARTPPTEDRAAVALETALAADRVVQGETVRFTAELSSRTGAEVPSPIARLGLPAGLEPQVWQLEELVEEGQIAFFELRPREVTLYWEGLAADETHRVELDLLAALPGSFAGPASSAWPYYDDTFRTWAPELEVEVTPAGEGG